MSPSFSIQPTPLPAVRLASQYSHYSHVLSSLLPAYFKFSLLTFTLPPSLLVLFPLSRVFTKHCFGSLPQSSRGSSLPSRACLSSSLNFQSFFHLHLPPFNPHLYFYSHPFLYFQRHPPLIEPMFLPLL